MTKYLDLGPGYRAQRDGAYTNLVDPEGRRVARLPGGAVSNLVSEEAQGKTGTSATRSQTTEQAYAISAREGILPSLRELLAVTRKWLWVILLMALLFAGGAIGFSLAQTPMYEASVKILVGQERPNNTPFDSNPGALEGEIQGLQLIAQTMVEAVQTRPMAEAAIWRLSLQMTPEELLGNLDVEQVHATQFVQVNYKDTKPERAQLVADTIGKVSSEEMSKVSPSANTITAIVWEQADLPDDPVSPNPLRNSLLALVFGAMIGVALAFLLEHWRGSWRSPEEVERISGVPTLGVITEFGTPKGAASRASKERS